MENKTKTIFFLTNSPGEISGWLRPLVKIVKKRLPEYRIAVILLPCVFASGREQAVIESLDEVDEVVGAHRFLSLLFDGTRGKDAELVHLGGDIMFTAFLARVWKNAAWCYQYGKKSIDRYYRGYFVKTRSDLERLQKIGISGNKVQIVGDLLIDSVHERLGSTGQSREIGEVRTICFMAGSRLKEVRSLLPFYLQVASFIRAHHGEMKFKALISPYIDRVELERLGILEPVCKLGGLRATIERVPGKLRSDDGTEIELVFQAHIKELEHSDFVITIPGTKTGEAGCLGIPMVVLLPLNKPEDIPYIGLIGLLDWLPFIGPRIKAPLIMKLAKTVGFVAQPNILSHREIVPEIKGILSAPDVARQILQVIGDRKALSTMSAQLNELYAPSAGAATRMVDYFARSVKPEYQPERPFFSIVICTRNRKELLPGAIRTLDEQTISPQAYEILIVDDGSDDGTDELMATMNTRCRLRYLQRPWQGRAATRNCGIREAAGEIIIFVDDDILAPRDFIKEHFRFHRAYPQAIVRGQIINIETYEFPREQKAALTDFYQAFFCTCNVSVARQELLDIGGFDETFVEYGYEDNEVGWRLRQKGLIARFNMKAIVYHFKPPKEVKDLDAMIRNAQELARSAVAYYRKHPHWKTRLATGIYPLYFAQQAIFANRFIKDFCLGRWKKMKVHGTAGNLKQLEQAIFNYYYTETLRDELKKKG